MKKRFPPVFQERGGFTLVELLVSSLIGSILLLSVVVTLADFSRKMGETDRREKIRTEVRSALETFRQDVERMGLGMPLGIPTLPRDRLVPGTAASAFLSWLVEFVLRSSNNDGNLGLGFSPPIFTRGGPPPQRIPETDEILFGGVGMDLSPTSQKSMFQIGNTTATWTDTLFLAVWDFAGVFNERIVDPTDTDGSGGNPLLPYPPYDFHPYRAMTLVGSTPAEFLHVVHLDEGWKTCDSGAGGTLDAVVASRGLDGCAPVVIESVDQTGGIATIRVKTDSGSPYKHYRLTGRNEIAFLSRGGMDLTDPRNRPWLFQVAHWYLRTFGGGDRRRVLVRRLIYDPRPSNIPPYCGTLSDPRCPEGIVLSNVISFQVAYGIWEPGAIGPQWFNNTRFEDLFYRKIGLYVPGGVPIYPQEWATRFMIARERLVAIRATVVVEFPGLGPYRGQNPIPVEDRMVTLPDPEHNDYEVFQVVGDPMNFRAKVGEIYRPIRTVADDQRTRTTTGLYDAVPPSGQLY